MRRSCSRFLFLGLLTAAVGCHVYNPDLLHQDGSPDRVADAGEAGDVAIDTRADVVTDGDAAVDTGTDVPIGTDSGPSCTALLAAGTPCIEPFSGQGFSADEPRLVAPYSVAVSADTNPLVVVGDLGTGRVMSYAQDGTMPHRIAGTGVLGVPSADGVATTTPLSSPTALQFLPSGDVLVADSVAHTIFILRRSMNRLERFGALSFQDGPAAMSMLDINTLLVAADNRIYSVGIGSGTPTTPTTLLGCGLACRGFNSTPVAGNLTQFDSPTGVDADASYLYVADSHNCRIRRTLRSSPTLTTTVFAGGGCDRNSDILGGSGGTVAANMAHLGPVGDVRVGGDGTVYFTDPEAHCAILAVATVGPNANLLRVIAGSSIGCGAPGVGGVALGRLGALGISDDRNTLYFVEAQNHRVGRIQLNLPGGPSAPLFGIAPGTIPDTGDMLPQLRAGAVSGVAATGTGADPTVYWAGAFEERVYRYAGGAVSAFAGDGVVRPIPPIPARNLEPSFVAGLGFGDGKLVMALQTHSSIAYAMGTGLFRVAGAYDSAGEPTLSGPAASDTITAPSFPIVHASNLYFGSQGPAPRVYRVDGATATNPIVPIAGVGAGGDGGVPSGDAGVSATTVALGRPTGLAFDGAENLYVADPVNHVIWRVSTGTIEIFAGVFRQVTPLDDTSNDARGVAIPDPQGLAFDGAHTLYVADRASRRIRAIDLTTSRIQTVAGAGTDASDFIAASSSSLGQVSSVAMLDNRLFFGEWDTGRVRVIRFGP